MMFIIQLVDCYLEAYHQVCNKIEKDLIAQVQENPKIVTLRFIVTVTSYSACDNHSCHDDWLFSFAI